MKNKLTTLLMISGLFFISITFNSCKKDEVALQETTHADLLTNGGWVMYMGTSTFGTTTVDFYALMPACEKDDITFLQTDGKVLKDEGPSKCDPYDPQSEIIGSWRLVDNGTKLEFTDEDGEVSVMTIVSLTTDELILEQTEYNEAIQMDETKRFGYRHPVL